MDHAMEKVKKKRGQDRNVTTPTHSSRRRRRMLSSIRHRIALASVSAYSLTHSSRPYRARTARSSLVHRRAMATKETGAMTPRRYRRRGRLQGRRVSPQGCHLPQQDHPRRRVHPRERQVPPVRILRVPVGVPRSLAASPQGSHRTHHGVVGAPHVAAHTTERPGRSTRGLVLPGRGGRVNLRAVRCRLVPRGAQSRVHSRRSFRQRLRARLVRQGDGRRRQGHPVHRANPVV